MKPIYTVLLPFMVLALFETPLQAQSQQSADTTRDSIRDASAKADTVAKDASDKDDSATKAPKHSHFEIGVTYQNNSVYLGRKDSSTLPYITPSITYNHKSGLYFTAEAAYLSNSTESRIDVVTLDAGYAFSAGIYNGDFTATKYFYNTQSTNVASGITASLAYQNGLDLGFIKPTVSATVDFGPTTDFNGSFGLEHTFEAFDDNLDITPTFVANASTLNYYDNYFHERRFKTRKGNQIVTGTVRTTGTVQDAGSFRILDYEASLPLSYAAGRWTFSFTPTYAIPVNPAIVHIHSVYSTGTVTNRTTVEKLENSFYCTMGVTFKL